MTTNTFALTSNDIQEGHPMAKTFAYSDWGSDGDNLSPQLRWQGVPEGTKSFAITCFDPDAPTGSGFWHWVATDIPANVTELTRGADMIKLGAREFRIDYGTAGFGGPCPPVGHGMHRYQFTVWALPIEKLEVGNDASPALVGFNLNSLALAKSTLTATYTR